MPEINSYEAHVTIEPVFGERFDQFDTCCQAHRFKPAELLLQKSRLATPERSNKDSFCTGHSRDYKEIYTRTLQLVTDLKEAGFDVWRYKIEGIVLDVRTPPFVQIRSVGYQTAKSAGLDVTFECRFCGKTYATEHRVFCTFCGYESQSPNDAQEHTCPGRKSHFKAQEHLRTLQETL